jgi:hypothetical protein
MAVVKAIIERISKKYLVPCIRPLNPPKLGDFEIGTLQIGGQGG